MKTKVTCIAKSWDNSGEFTIIMYTPVEEPGGIDYVRLEAKVVCEDLNEAKAVASKVVESINSKGIEFDGFE
jgi:hypothetical protein